MSIIILLATCNMTLHVHVCMHTSIIRKIMATNITIILFIIFDVTSCNEVAYSPSS